MDAKQFLAEFGHIANAPGGVQQICTMVRDLAVKGDLTEKFLNENAHKEFEFAKNYLENLEISGAYPKRPKLLDIAQHELPFPNLPNNWCWYRFGELLEIQGGGQPPKSNFVDSPKKNYILDDPVFLN
ncbi:MAG: hypothetical protein PHP23_04915 [Desulfobacterales bacterium]|nr:hypothetical protein [Desulfobacterales bacterium]MDD4072793.1 hypothetical protein [Desulfobacterales bacterium]MDD4392090.1 hypothetical protein [Desulfobacterales bacterium]